MCSGTPTYLCCRFSYSLIRRRRARSSCTATTRLLQREPKPPGLGIEAPSTHGSRPIAAMRRRPRSWSLPTVEIIRFLTGEQEQHISADVAFGVWNYWQATGDDRFLVEAGAEILIETARFWASRVEREEDGRYHIRSVIGPDEYHETVDDNAYTNGLAQWNLEVAAEIARSCCGTLAGAVAGAFAPLGLEAGGAEPSGCMSLAISTPGSTSRPASSSSSGLFRLGGYRPCRVRAANRADGRAARSRAHSAVQDHQAARCRNAGISPLGAPPPGGAQSRILIITSHAAGMEAR